MIEIRQKSKRSLLQLDEPESGRHTLVIQGWLSAMTVGDIWLDLDRLLQSVTLRDLTVEASGIEYCDGSGIALLFNLRRKCMAHGTAFAIQNLPDEFQKLLDMFDDGSLQKPVEPIERDEPLAITIGRRMQGLIEDARHQIAFVGELSANLLRAVIRPHSVRWVDVGLVAETAGVNALPIVSLIGFLMGLILAFQSTVPMREFDLEIYAANLVALSVLRELGPLMTAIVLAGRTGSAFAAEIGTMKVGEEVDALKTMGLDPVHFLVTPRTLAAVFVTPLLTIYANLMGLLGGAVVILSLGYPLVTYIIYVQSAVTYVDLFGGLVKSVVFGLLVAGVGCLRGLETGTGARAVGASTTSAVVSAIVLITIADCIFSVLYYYLGI